MEKISKWLEKVAVNDALPLKAAQYSDIANFKSFWAIQTQTLALAISYIRALWRSGLSARVPECQKL